MLQQTYRVDIIEGLEIKAWCCEHNASRVGDQRSDTVSLTLHHRFLIQILQPVNHQLNIMTALFLNVMTSGVGDLVTTWPSSWARFMNRQCTSPDKSSWIKQHSLCGNKMRNIFHFMLLGSKQRTVVVIPDIAMTIVHSNSCLTTWLKLRFDTLVKTHNWTQIAGDLH